MDRFAIYDIETGLISRVVTTPRDLVSLQVGAGFRSLAVVGDVPPVAFVDLSQDPPAVTAAPPCPGPGWRFDPAAAAWVDERGPAEVAADLAAAQAAGFSAIDAAVASARRLFISDLPGQDLIYSQKAAEAAAYLAADAPADLAGFPWLAAEVGLTAPTAAEVAAVILGLADMWAALGAAMEGARFRARAAVMAAADPPAVSLAVEDLAAELAALGQQ